MRTIKDHKLISALVLFAVLVMTIYTVLVRPRRFFQCLSAPVDYFRRDYGQQRASLPDPIPGNHLRLLVNGDEALPAMLAMLDGAQESIRFQVMLFKPDEAGRQVADALVRAARRGTQVQLSFNLDQTVNGTIADQYSTEKKEHLNREMQLIMADLQAAGVEFRDNPAEIDFPCEGASSRACAIQQEIQRNACVPMNHYDHRKIIVVDHRQAFLGGMNIGSSYLYHVQPQWTEDMVAEAQQRLQNGQDEAWEKWFDAAAVLDGPVVTALAEEFDWKWEVLGGSPLPTVALEPLEQGVPVQFLTQRPGQPQVGARFFELVDNAQQEIWVASPFVSYEPALEALQAASRRGVRVVFVFPNERQEMALSARIFRDHTNSLTQSGIEVYFNDLRMAHTKLMVVDGQQVLLGSFNLNHRSFRHDLEVAAVVEDPAFAQQVIERIFQPYLQISHPIRQPLDTPWSPLDWFLKPFS